MVNFCPGAEVASIISRHRMVAKRCIIELAWLIFVSMDSRLGKDVGNKFTHPQHPHLSIRA